MDSMNWIQILDETVYNSFYANDFMQMTSGNALIHHFPHPATERADWSL